MFCTNCGKELPENALFCPSCGKSVFLSPATSPVSSQTTPIADINQQNTLSSPLEPSPSAMNLATVKCQDSPQYPAQTVTMPVANQQPSVPSVITANIPIPPVNLSTLPLAHKNLWERFKENRHVDEPNLMQINFNDQNTLIALQQIMGSGYYYYLPRLQHIQATGTSKFNWYSMFLGLLHAGYRNVWREWLEKMKWVLLIYVIAQILPLLFALLQAPTLTITTIPIAYFMSLPVTIYAIVIAKSFDKIYMRHIQKKLLANDFSPDESMGRGFKVVGVAIIISLILLFITMSSLSLLFAL